MNTRRLFALSLFLVLLLPFPAESGADPYDNQPPINNIVFPRIGFPEFTTPNGDLNVTIVGSLTNVRFHLENELNSFSLTVLSSVYDAAADVSKVSLHLSDAETGLYSLAVRGEDDSLLFREPNCIFVRTNLELPFLILWLSDTHYDNIKGQKHLEHEFVRDVWIANFFRPDLVLITGDVVNKPPEDLFKGVYRELQRLDVPILLVPGNHDHAIKGDLFTKYLAISNASLNVGPIHFISMDTGPGSLNGDITKDQLDWLSEELERNQGRPIRIFMCHHPLHGIANTSEANVSALISMLLEYDTDIALHGHMHYSEVFKEPLLILVNPNAYGATSGFRLLSIPDEETVEWEYAGTEEPIPKNDIDVQFYQENDGSAYGSTVKLVNNLLMPVAGHLRLRVRPGEGLWIENGTLEGNWSAREGDYIVVDLGVELDPGETKMARIYTVSDEAPPSMLDMSAEIIQGARTNIIWLNLTLRDDVLGVEGAELKYSIDGEAWESIQLLRIDADTFVGKLQLDNSIGKAYVSLRVWDPEGSANLIEEELIVFEQPPEKEVPSRSWEVIGGLSVVVIVAVLVVILSIRRRS